MSKEHGAVAQKNANKLDRSVSKIGENRVIAHKRLSQARADVYKNGATKDAIIDYIFNGEDESPMDEALGAYYDEMNRLDDNLERLIGSAV